MANTENTKAFYNAAVPSGWEVVKVADFGKVHTGNTPPTNEIENYGTKYLFVSPGDLTEGKYITKTEKRLSEAGFMISRKFPKGSVLFTCIGSTIGKSGIASEDLTSNQQINAIVVNAKNSNEFLYYQLERNANKIKLLAGEQAVPIINKSQFEAVKLLRAPLPEQCAIAQVLSLMDRAINTNNQIIAQQELRKKWLMQNLLTGKKRLSGFEGEWKYEILGNLVDLQHGYQFRDEDFVREGIPVIKIRNVIGYQLVLTDMTFVDSNRLEEFKSVVIKNGDLLMSLTGNIGRVVEVEDVEAPMFQNYRVGKFTPKDHQITKSFLKFLLSSDVLFSSDSRFVNI